MSSGRGREVVIRITGDASSLRNVLKQAAQEVQSSVRGGRLETPVFTPGQGRSASGRLLFKSNQLERDIASGQAEQERRRLERKVVVGREAKDPAIVAGLAAKEEERLNKIRNFAANQAEKLRRAEERLVLERERGESKADAARRKPPKFLQPPPIDRATAVALQTARGQRNRVFQAGDAIDRVSTSFLKMVNPAHRTNAQISDSAQTFLALGGILAPLNSRLGMTVLQMGFAAFSFGGVGVALAAITIAIAGVIAVLKAWTKNILEWSRIARTAGAVSVFATQASNDLNNAIQQTSIALGQAASKDLVFFTKKLTDLRKSAFGANSAFATLQTGLIKLASTVGSVLIPALELALTAFNQFIAGLADTLELFSLGNARTGLPGMENIPFPQGPLDSFLASLSGLERNLVLSGDAVTKFGFQQARLSQTQEDRFLTNQRNRVQVLANLPEDAVEANARTLATAAAIEFNKIGEIFNATITGLQQAATGIVKEQRTERPTKAQIDRELVILTEMLEELRAGRSEPIDELRERTFRFLR